MRAEEYKKAIKIYAIDIFKMRIHIHEAQNR